MDFLKNMLQLFKIPIVLNNLVTSCLKNIQYTPIINGRKTQIFRPSREIRQGDPISLYIFIRGMKFLNHLMQNKINNKQWHPFVFINKEPKISHLLFADDILLLSKANTSNILTMNEVLNKFCSTSGLEINFDKSKVWFSKIV